MAVTVSKDRSGRISVISGGTVEEQRAKAQDIQKEDDARKEQAKFEREASKKAYGGKSPSQMSNAEREEANRQYLAEVQKEQETVKRSAPSSSPNLLNTDFETRQAYNQANLSYAQDQQAFINKALSYGFSRQDAERAISTGQQLMPSQSKDVQELTRRLKEEGYSNIEIYDFFTAGKIPRREFATGSLTEATAPNFRARQLSNAEAFAQKVAPKSELVRNIFTFGASTYGGIVQGAIGGADYLRGLQDLYKRETVTGKKAIPAFVTVVDNIGLDVARTVKGVSSGAWQFVSNPKVPQDTFTNIRQNSGEALGDVVTDVFIGSAVSAGASSVSRAFTPKVSVVQSKVASVTSELPTGSIVGESSGKVRVMKDGLFVQKVDDFDFKSTQLLTKEADNLLNIKEVGTLTPPKGKPLTFEARGISMTQGLASLTKTDIVATVGKTTQQYKTLGETLPLTDTSTITNTLIGKRKGSKSQLIGAEVQTSQEVAQKTGAYPLTGEVDGVSVTYNIPAEQKLYYSTSTKVQSPQFSQTFKASTWGSNPSRLSLPFRESQTQKLVSAVSPSSSATTVLLKDILQTAQATQTATQVSQVVRPVASLVLVSPTTTQKNIFTSSQATKETQTTAQTPVLRSLPLAQETAQTQTTKTATGLSQDTTQKLIQSSKVSLTPVQSNLMKVSQVSKVSPATVSTGRLRVAPSFKFGSPLAEEVPKPILSDDDDKPKRKGFNVFVRRRGKFGQVNAQSLPYEDALRLGAFKVQSGASATFKVEASTQEAKGSFGVPFSLANFYQKGNLYIQKNINRISSLGEKQEITAKGIQAQRKSIFGKV